MYVFSLAQMNVWGLNTAPVGVTLGLGEETSSFENKARNINTITTLPVVNIISHHLSLVLNCVLHMFMSA